MPPPDGNFEDYVVLTQDTLAHRGAELKIGGATASTVHLALSNSAGQLDLQAAPTGNGTVVFPTSGGTLLTNVNISGGTTSSNVSAVTFSNANNVSFGFDGSNITATATVASSQGSINISAGTTSRNLSAVTFSNSNNVSFGLNGSTMTASASVATSAAAIGGLSSFAAQQPLQTYLINSASMSLAPIVVPYNLTITQLAVLNSFTAPGNSVSLTWNAGLYSVSTATGGVSNWTLSLASSVTTLLTSNTQTSLAGLQYRFLPIASWNVTPGLYVLAIYMSASNAMTIWGAAPTGSLVQVGGLQSFIMSGLWNSTNMPASIGVSDTASYVRNNTSALSQPWVLMQGS